MVASELDFRHASAARGLGYLPIGNFNGNPAATFFGEKQLSG
jgi:hypothetical protein